MLPGDCISSWKAYMELLSICVCGYIKLCDFIFIVPLFSRNFSKNVDMFAFNS